MRATITETEAMTTIENSIHWGAIFAGVLIALITGIIFNLLGTAVGFSIFLPHKENFWPLTMGTIIWLILTGIISMYAGGWIAGRFGNARTNLAGMLYGAIVSSISTIISLIIMIVTVGAVLSTSFSVLGNIISASSAAVAGTGSIIGKGLEGVSRLSPELGDKVKRAMPDLKPIVDKINQEAANLLPKRTPNEEVSPETIKAQLDDLIRDYLASVEGMNYEEARNKLVDTLIEHTGKSREEVQAIVSKWQERYVATKEKIYGRVLDSGKKVAHMISQIALINFFIIVSSLLAAAMGGVRGVRSRYEARDL